MQKLLPSHIFSSGLTIFAMFFGAGNVVFPLALGQFSSSPLSILGFTLTGVFVPLMGFIAMLFYRGNYASFFGRIGSLPGFILAFFIISLLGPLGSTPRCIAVAFSTFKEVFPHLSSWLFSALGSLFIFACTIKRNLILPLLGWVLTPLLLLSLFTLVFVGLFFTPDAPHSTLTHEPLFFHGLLKGYQTMDLLAAFFFSSTLLKSLKTKGSSSKMIFYASLLGAFLLSATYIGLFKLAACHSGSLTFQSESELLGALAMKIAGPLGGTLVCITVSLACFTTAIALITAFTDFLEKEVFKKKISYTILLASSLFITFIISTFEYQGIAAFLSPLLKICYPGLILLTLINLGAKLKSKQGALL